MGYRVVCFVNPNLNGSPCLIDPSLHSIGLPVVDWVGSDEDAEVLRVGHCVLALDAMDRFLRDNIIRALTSRNIFDIHVIPAMRGIPLYGMTNSHFFSHDVLMIHVQNNLSRPFLKILKRCFDIILASLLLLLLSPIFIYAAFKIKSDGGSVFFGHKRMGQNGKWFYCLKFRSMAHNSSELLKKILAADPLAKAEWDRDFKLKNDPRVTKFGKFIRSTSIDELPQLINVIKGEMSLVGPRPIIEAELQRYKDDAYYYLLAKPGITGLWQVSGRSDVEYDTRVYFDAWYVKNWSLWTDIAILFKTFKVVLNKNGAY
jgi:undecaprenyl-phosphate galactose phosphotransferase